MATVGVAISATLLGAAGDGIEGSLLLSVARPAPSSSHPTRPRNITSSSPITTTTTTTTTPTPAPPPPRFLAHAPAQYLFQCPEGLARLALEHGTRPGPGLRAVFLASPSPEHAGGLPALLLRLASDGHGEVEIVGPTGTARSLHALRHLLAWRHPRVCVTDLIPDPDIPDPALGEKSTSTTST